MLTTRRALVSSFVLAFAWAACHAADETDRLISLARVWASVKYLDPDVVANGVDWDAALVKAIPAVRRATSDDDFAAAIDAMLSEVHDPATRVVTEKPEGPAAKSHGPFFRWEGDVLVVLAGGYGASPSSGPGAAAAKVISPELAKAKGLVIDLRGSPEFREDADELVSSLDRLSKVRLAGPSWQYVFHSGYATQSGQSSGGYYSAFLETPGAGVAAGAEGSVPARIGVVADADTALPDTVLALLNARAAIVVSAAPLNGAAAARIQALTLDDRHTVRFRVGRTRFPAMSGILDPDPLAAAIRYASGATPQPEAPRAQPETPFETVVFPPERAYAEMTYPDVEYRLLAAFRLWAVISYFYPYSQLIGDWDAALQESIPKFIAAENADAYAKAVLELDARVEDGHSYATGHPALATLFGTWSVPFRVRYIEAQYVVTWTGGKDPVVHIGDVIVSVDGEPMADRVKRLWPYFAASTEPARRLRVAFTALRGPKDSSAEIELRDAKGLRRVSVPRVERNELPGSDNSYKILDGNIGYVDLSRITPPQVDAMFETLMDTKAIVFDMRGYPKGTAWSIAPRINTRKAKVGAVFRRRQVSGITTNEEGDSGFFFEQPLYATQKPLYQGKTVMLIDEQAISQAEHTCLFFEAANGTTFVGSPTAGANGDVTNFPLPGGFRVMFTGHDVRHADGRQLQRVGIKPDISVTPTIAGLRAGKDEVLDRAIRFVQTGK